jgi:hypothetical protein
MKEAAMIDPRRGSARRYVGAVTTAIVSIGTAAAIGWTAAVPVGGSASTTATTVASGAGATRTSQQIDAARANLQQVRADLARLLSREDDIPRAKLATLSALVAQLPTVQVPQSSAQPTVTHVTAPATHTTTGASGARP